MAAAFGPVRERALELLAESVPDVMLVDVEMPTMDGLEFCRLLREQEDTRWWATDADDVLCDWPTARTAP